MPLRGPLSVPRFLSTEKIICQTRALRIALILASAFLNFTEMCTLLNSLVIKNCPWLERIY